MTVFLKKSFSLILIFVLAASTFPSSIRAAAFSDVGKEHWAYPSIEWGVSRGIIKGYKDGSFKPNNQVTEAQFITMLSRLDRSSDNTYPTNPGEYFAEGTYRYFKSKHMPLNGLNDSQVYMRDQPITRGEVARIMAAFYGYDLSLPNAVYFMYKKNLSNGLTGKKDYRDYGVDQYMTRAQTAAFFERLGNQGSSKMIGLKQKASGKDNYIYEVPLGFMDDGTIVFPPPASEEPPPSSEKGVQAIDIEKEVLIANGVDSTFVTVTLNDCNGELIPYEESLAFTVTSAAGAELDSGKEFDETDHIAPERWIDDKYDEGIEFFSAASIKETISMESDGPDISVRVTAPAADKVIKDKITIQPVERSGEMSCYRKPITVNLEYRPQAELRLEIEESSTNIIPADNVSDATFKATVVLPGGEIASDFNGRVRFNSDKAELSHNEVDFYNGVARTNIEALYSNRLIAEDITAKIIEYDTEKYGNKLNSILFKTHHLEVFFEPLYRMDYSCPRPEVAFILDSSGSMNTNDPEYLRVVKSKELAYSLNSQENIAVKFNSKGKHLGTGDPWYVSNYLDNVDASGGTNIKGGLKEAFDRYSNYGPRVAILLTDGKSNSKQAKEMIEEAKRESITIYTIGLGNQVNEELLQELAYKTGGQYYPIEAAIQLGEAFQSILDSITCGGSIGKSCTYSELMFINPTVEITKTDIYMNTYLEEYCRFDKVVVRFNSYGGDIDYELVHRGQNYYAIKRGADEILDYDLLEGAQILAFSSHGDIIASRNVPIQRN